MNQKINSLVGGLMQVGRAIISVTNKSGVVEFAKGLKSLGIEILSTGGTARELKAGGIDVREISEYTGFPEILDGRLKTLHPLVHGGILGIRDNPHHKKEMEKNGIGPIDLVVVNLYPFEDAVSKPDCCLEGAIENIDIGGPTMIRAAAKNYRDVAVVVEPADYAMILDGLKKNKCRLDEVLLFKLAQKAFAHTARYDTAIGNYLGAVCDGKKTDDFPEEIGFAFKKVQNLRYGENPHQRAAFYREHNVVEPSVSLAEQIHGKELSYNNVVDTDAAIELVREFDDFAAAAIIKHANPCGVATDASISLAFKRARETDPVSAYGGIVALNRGADKETASFIAETFFEVVVAPSFSKDALNILTKKKNIRLLKVEGLGTFGFVRGWTMKKVVGGLLVQGRDLQAVDVERCRVVTRRSPTEEEYRALDFAWRVSKHVKSNAIVFGREGQLVGVGAGQMSRVDSVRIAMMKAVLPLKGTSIASDAFFPFRDGVDIAASSGATAIIQPGGSVRDEEVIQAADEHGMAMVFTGVRHFRH